MEYLPEYVQSGHRLHGGAGDVKEGRLGVVGVARGDPLDWLSGHGGLGLRIVPHATARNKKGT